MVTKSLYDFCIENKNKKYLLDEWDYEKNEINPKEIGHNSYKDFWWKCKFGHKWEAPVSRRTREGKNCPYCTNQKLLVGFNDLATKNPELAKEWNYGKNGDLKPTDVTAGSEKKVWWVCEKGHEWDARIADRARRKGCPYCSGRRVWVGFNDLATTHPELAKQWHPSKNGSLKPTDIIAGSKRKIWWICECGYEWETELKYRTKLNRGCSCCSKKEKEIKNKTKKSANISLEEKSNSIIEKKTNNAFYLHGSSLPEAIIYSALKSIYKKVYHRYKIDNTEFDICVDDIKLLIEYDGEYWHKNKREKDKRKDKIAKKNGFIFVRVWEYSKKEESIEDFCKDKNTLYFYPNKGKYETLTQQLFAHLNLFYKLNIEYVAPQNEEQIARKYIEKVCKEKSISTLRPDLVKEWDFEGNEGLNPDCINVNSSYRASWICQNNHKWKAPVYRRTIKGKNCPYCAGQKVLAGYNDFPTTCPELLKYWDFEKNTVSPTTVSKGSTKKYYWIRNGYSSFKSPLKFRQKHKMI